MAYGDTAWKTSRLWLSPLTKALTNAKAYGLDRWPREGGCVLAITHLHWVDIPVVGALSPRNINYVAKTELANVPGFGHFLGWHGIITVRRGQSDRDAVRMMREYARAGRAVGVFVEGTRTTTGEPGEAMPGAAMVAIQESVPVVPIAIYGTPGWKFTHRNDCSIAVGEPFMLEGYPKGGKGYKDATVEIERRIRVLFDWLAEVHADGRPDGLEPPL
jgi:1-acyl-sn-glycerol-3-phosphate acyltransferase